MQTTIEAEAQIRAIVQTLVDGWNKGDGDLFAKHFAADADYMVWNGMYSKGKAGIAAGHNHIFSAIYKDTVQKIEILQIRFLRDDVAIVHTQGGVVTEDKEWPSVKPLFILTCQDGEWQIDAFQNTPIMEQSSPS
jgi:uncharacterized protein (TIGR02246 family)